jgi:hypothetical protein
LAKREKEGERHTEQDVFLHGKATINRKAKEEKETEKRQQPALKN